MARWRCISRLVTKRSVRKKSSDGASGKDFGGGAADRVRGAEVFAAGDE